ncbi:MAG TPA: chemotaxis protein CheA [Xanthobacteraceae bacterium]
MNPLHEQFITEARELVQQATDDLIALDREGPTPERIDRVFRAFHTLKGSAGIVELPAMGLMLHAAEDLLAALHAGHVAADSAVVDQGLACLDQVSQWVDEFEVHATLPTDAAEAARVMAERLRALLPGNGSEPEAASHGPLAASVAGALPAWISDLVDSQSAPIARALGERPRALWAISYEPHTGCFFNGDDPVGMMRQVPDLLAFRIEPREAWHGLADLDPYVCNLRLRAISGGDRAELARIFRLVPDQVRIVEVPAEALRPGQEMAAAAGDSSGLIRSIIAEQQASIRASSGEEDFAGRVGAAARSAANALRHGRRGDWAERIELAGAAALSQRDAASLLSALDEALASMRDHSAADDHASVSEPADSPAGEAAARPALRLLRVDEVKIDALVNMAGELIVAKNGLAHLARRVQDTLGDRSLADAVDREHETIERLAGDLHAAILQLRMVPLAQVLRPFPRLVRDMSQRLHKKVALTTRGETAEADKAIVDRLFEPLLHLVRNALDHGIEGPEERRAAGKHEVASIAIQASRSGDRFVAEVIDDGRGIDPAAIRRKARERKLMAEDELAALSDEQVIDLIFLAGFSTAVEISDISGRGVGMDVVRTTVEQIGGRVSVTSAVGAGTTVRLDLPLNIALSRIMVVETGGQSFGVPMDAVTETVRLTPDRIRQIKSNNGFVWRDRVVPICPLAELMKLPGKPSGLEAKLLIVAEAGGKLAALEVDAIGDRLDIVLKPMQGLLAGAKGYSGTTLLGDGRVLLVLDLKEMLS